MDKEINQGGYTFGGGQSIACYGNETPMFHPTSGETLYVKHEHGMSVRTHAAIQIAAAIQSSFAENSRADAVMILADKAGVSPEILIARSAIVQADALIKELGL